MNKIYRIIGVAAVVITLVCNLEYSAFFKLKNNPNVAKAAWTYTDPIYLTEAVYCGSSPDRLWKPGTWYRVNTTYYYSAEFGYPGGYQDHIWYFVPYDGGSMCGLDRPSSVTNFRYNGYEITAPEHPTVAY